MQILEMYGKEIVAVLVPFITWALNSLSRTKVKLFLASPHTFNFLVQEPLLNAQGQQVQPNQMVYTRSIMITNAGSQTATNLELVFNWKPPCINLWPVRHFEEHTEPDNRYVMVFGTLAPSENLGCELLSINKELPFLVTVRCDQCVAETIEMYPQPVAPVWKRRVGMALLFLGFAAFVYGAITLLQFLVLKTPLGF